jgi:uroporphyrinogen-III decarboxylase
VPPPRAGAWETSIEAGDRNGRFVLGSGCALPGESRPENIEALVAAAQAYSRGGEPS